MLSELLYAANSIFMTEAIERLTSKFSKRKEVSGSKDLNVDLGKTKVMVSESVTWNGRSKSKV